MSVNFEFGKRKKHPRHTNTPIREVNQVNQVNNPAIINLYLVISMSLPLSNYEKARLERIRENQLVLAEIGLNSAAKAIRRAEADAKIARRANAALKRAALKRKREEERNDDVTLIGIKIGKFDNNEVKEETVFNI